MLRRYRKAVSSKCAQPSEYETNNNLKRKMDDRRSYHSSVLIHRVTKHRSTTMNLVQKRFTFITDELRIFGN